MQSQLGGVGLDEGKSVMDHIKIQGYGVFVTGLWTIVVTFLILKIISMFSDLRVTEDEELKDLIRLYTGKVDITTKSFHSLWINK